MNITGEDGEQRNLDFLVLDQGFAEDGQDVEGDRQQPDPPPLAEGAVAATTGDQGDESHQYEEHVAEEEAGRQQIDQFERAGVQSGKQNPGFPEGVHLFVEFFQVDFALVEEGGLLDEPGGESRFANTEALVNVFPDNVLESVHFVINLLGKSHIEGAGQELVNFFGAAADAAGGHHGGHGVVDGELDIRKILIGAVRSAVAIHIVVLQLLPHNGDICWRDDAVGVEKEVIVAGSQVHTLVTALASTVLGVEMMMHVDAVGIACADLVAAVRGVAFHDQHLKVLVGLIRQTLQQFGHLVGPVVNGNDDGQADFFFNSHFLFIYSLQKYKFYTNLNLEFLYLCAMNNNPRITQSIQQSIAVKQAMLDDNDFLSRIERAAQIITESLRGGGKIHFCGNGGSAADAQHLAAELSGRFYFDRPPLNAEALHCNTSYLTAVGNDYGYDLIFARLLRGTAKEGDVIVGISTSGNSQNILKAFEVAKEMNVKIIAMTGETGGAMKDYADILLNVASKDTPRIQESHIMIGHIICELVETAMFGSRL